MNKNKASFFPVLILALICALIMTACVSSSEPSTLEEFAAGNEDIQKSIDNAAADSNTKVTIKGNEIIYSYDLANTDGYSDEIVHDEQIVADLEKSLDKSASTFENIAGSVQEASGIEGIKTTVIYKFGDETIVKRTFTASADSSKDSADGSSDDSNDESDDE